MGDPPIDPELERGYLPSVTVPHAETYFEAWAEQSRRVRETHPPTELAYGSGANESLDLFEPAGASRATVLFLHGGYWRAFYKDHFSYLAPALLDAGLAVAIPSYDLAPQVRLATIVGQVRRACAMVADVRPGPIVTSGHSAGGHLTAMLHATHWEAMQLPVPPIEAAVAISGVFRLEPLRATRLQQDLRLSEADATSLSPVRHAPTSSAPFVLAVGELEPPPFHEQSEALHAAWPAITRAPVALPGRHHFTAPDALAELVLGVLDER